MGWSGGVCVWWCLCVGDGWWWWGRKGGFLCTSLVSTGGPRCRPAVPPLTPPSPPHLPLPQVVKREPGLTNTLLPAAAAHTNGNSKAVSTQDAKRDFARLLRDAAEGLPVAGEPGEVWRAGDTALLCSAMLHRVYACVLPLPMKTFLLLLAAPPLLQDARLPGRPAAPPWSRRHRSRAASSPTSAGGPCVLPGSQVGRTGQTARRAALLRPSERLLSGSLLLECRMDEHSLAPCPAAARCPTGLWRNAWRTGGRCTHA